MYENKPFFVLVMPDACLKLDASAPDLFTTPFIPDEFVSVESRQWPRGAVSRLQRQYHIGSPLGEVAAGWVQTLLVGASLLAGTGLNGRPGHPSDSSAARIQAKGGGNPPQPLPVASPHAPSNRSPFPGPLLSLGQRRALLVYQGKRAMPTTQQSDAQRARAGRSHILSDKLFQAHSDFA